MVTRDLHEKAPKARVAILISGRGSNMAALIEAAKVDGAGRIRRFWSVTLPGISPTLCLLAVLAFIYSLQQFALIYLSTGGGPGESSTTLSILIYNQAFEFFNYSYASAIAVVGLILSVIGTVLFVFIERRLVRSRR